MADDAHDTETDGEYGGAGALGAMDAETARHPQPMYRALREGSPVFEAGGHVIVTRRRDVDQVLRHPEVFSSGMSAVDLQNVRPLIPLQIDPPRHRDFRRLLDPLLAPQKMNRHADDIAGIVNDRIDDFGDATEIDFVTQFSA